MRLHTCVLVFVAALVFVIVAGKLLWYKTPAVGFDALLLVEGPRVQTTDHWGNVLVVRVDASRTWHLNSRKLSRAELKSILKEALCSRTEKVLLFEADPEIRYGDAIETIDSIHSICDVKIALITPATKNVDRDRLYLPNHAFDGENNLPASIIPKELQEDVSH